MTTYEKSIALAKCAAAWQEAAKECFNAGEETKGFVCQGRMIDALIRRAQILDPDNHSGSYVWKAKISEVQA